MTTRTAIGGLWAAAGLAFVGASCGKDPGATDASADRPELAPLDDARLLRRLSLDLRGTLPTLGEVAAVEADPQAVWRYRDAWLADPELEERLVSMLAERFKTRLDLFQVRYYDYGLPEADACTFARDVGEEPLRLMARVAVDGRPWTEIATSETTMATETLARVWPVSYPEDGEGWEEASYLDGRPAAGVLMTNGLWWRYVTSKSNANRSRAAALSDLLLCSDMLARPVSFSTSPSLADADGTAKALRENDACLACHAAIEPLAANFFGFYPSIDYNAEELGRYHPEREGVAETILGVSPGYFGQPTAGLIELGAAVAADPRFDRCAAETAAAMLWRRDVELADFDRVEALREDFLAGERLFVPLMAAVTDTPEYQAGELLDDSDPDADRELTTRMLSPDQLSAVVKDLTGFIWTYEGCDQLANDDVGYRVLAGGVDGDKVVRQQQDPGLTWALVVKRAAQGAAESLVGRELLTTPATSVLSGVTLDDRPGDAVFDAAVSNLYLRALSIEPGADEVDAALALWSDVEAVAGPEAAWTALISAVLRDPQFVSY